jgi:hypothetical protein
MNPLAQSPPRHVHKPEEVRGWDRMGNSIDLETNHIACELNGFPPTVLPAGPSIAEFCFNETNQA